MVPSTEFGWTPEFGDRLKSVIESYGTLLRAGEVAGVSDEQMARWRDGKARPSFFGMASLCSGAGVSLDWLLNGTSDDVPQIGDALEVGELARDFTLVPRLGVQASAGHGLVALAEEVTERLAFKTEWLRDMGLSPQFVGLVTCRGDSQDPVIKDGALMLVDMRPDQVIRSGCFYVIVLDGDVLVKLVNRKTDGTIELISHNPAYPKETIDSQRLDKLTIPGRVVWAGQKL
ncbi:XRE family transcriptional regulator [Devosia sediminis]|uniref:Helix-turn-helix transcriptional regulator n=1 Tax=Devosia sediminis TaxID=2798801 RepID=A0A934MIV5_9HYPH|nr:helix-turn-helix transcriptional regulator [Devosia sediminis]MBJ3783378.1 helix-turn-helix transcriptional regulator [Devosia sediminis]